jgi:hypothetical protein
MQFLINNNLTFEQLIQLFSHLPPSYIKVPLEIKQPSSLIVTPRKVVKVEFKFGDVLRDKPDPENIPTMIYLTIT